MKSKRRRQVLVPVSQECYLEMVAALDLAGGARDVGKAGAQLGAYLFVPVIVAQEPQLQMPQVDDAIARHKARVL